MPAPYKIFTIYAREDAAYLEELRGQLRPLENAGRIKVWSDREINPGVNWEQEIVHNLDTADIILILVSAAYYNSAYIHDKEIRYALARHEQGQAKVLPIIVRPVDFSDDPVISRLQVLPTDGKPVNDRRHWQERDDAWLDVVAGIKRTLAVLMDAENRQKQQGEEALERMRQAELAAEKKEQEAVASKRKQQEALPAAQKREAAKQAGTAKAPVTKEPLVTKKPLESSTATQNQPPKAKPGLPSISYAFWIGGLLTAALGVWLALDFFKAEKKEPVGVHTLSPASLPENVGTQVNKSGLIMVPVAGGAFTMGSPTSEENRISDECQHLVGVQSFSIGKYEVTQADWRNIMGNKPSYFKGCDDCPVEQVSWNDAQDFIEKLNAKYPGKNYRLPTETEWEYAARSKKLIPTTKDLYAGSDIVEVVAWYGSNSSSKTHPVGGKLPNELGLYDMSGNVWEWCQVIYKPYPCDHENVGSGSNRVLRGGSWGGSVDDCRVAGRNNYSPEDRNSYIGFRLASSPQ